MLYEVITAPSRGRTVFMPFLLQSVTDFITFRQLGGERSFANAGGVGLEDTDNFIDMAWPESSYNFV